MKYTFSIEVDPDNREQIQALLTVFGDGLVGQVAKDVLDKKCEFSFGQKGQPCNPHPNMKVDKEGNCTLIRDDVLDELFPNSPPSPSEPIEVHPWDLCSSCGYPADWHTDHWPRPRRQTRPWQSLSFCRAQGVHCKGFQRSGPYDLREFERYVAQHRAWSEHTFGPKDLRGTVSVIDHLQKELAEVKANPTDLSEWCDIIILAIDGAWRSGHNPQELAAALVAKQRKNFRRQWPNWRTADPDKAVEHVREDEQ